MVIKANTIKLAVKTGCIGTQHCTRPNCREMLNAEIYTLTSFCKKISRIPVTGCTGTCDIVHILAGKLYSGKHNVYVLS